MTTEHLSLNIQIRSVTGKKVRRLRREGWIPAIVYGQNFPPLAVQVSDREFQKVYQQVGRTSFVHLTIPGQAKQAAFIQEVQRHPVSRAIIHADFRVVDLKVAINAEVPILLIGTSPLVARGEAVINQALTHVEIRALPEELPQHIEIDVSELDSFEKSVHVADLPSSPRYTFVTPSEALVVSLTRTRAAAIAEEEEEAPPAEPELLRRERVHEEES